MVNVANISPASGLLNTKIQRKLMAHKFPTGEFAEF